MVKLSEHRTPAPRRSRPTAVPAVLLVSLIVSTLLVSACSRSSDWLQTNPDLVARARRDPQSFVFEAVSRWDDLRGMVGSYQVRARRGTGSRTLDAHIYLLRDRFVTVEVLAPTGSSEGYLTAGAREVGFWTSDENRLYRGPNGPGEFGRALGLALNPDQIVAVLTGFAVPHRAGEELPAQWDERAQRIRVDGGDVIAWLHPLYGRFDRVVVATDSGPIEIDYEQWAEGGPPVPLRMRVAVASEDITLDLRLAASWQPNPAGMDERFFDVEVPASGPVQVSLSVLAIEGGLLRRGFGR